MLPSYEIKPLDAAILQQARQKIDLKTKPPGSLGRIEELATQICAIQETLEPNVDPAKLLIFAGDHGMVAEGISAWPSEVTAQMVANFINGGAAANVFARTNDIAITVIDAGVATDLAPAENLIHADIRNGTRNAMHEDALTAGEVEAALEFGARVAADAVRQGTRTILLGEMGIGNTSSATLLANALEGIGIEELTGPGAGLDAPGVKRKTEILRQIAARVPGRLDPIRALSAFGGLEIAMMAGALIGAAANGAIVLIDGFIATAAALSALRARPEAMEYVVFAHCSKEPGHKLVLEALGAEPLMRLDLRLGEGTGALLAFPLLRNACTMVNEMATFESAGVSGKEDG